jgi:hypothetical protein
MLTGIPNGQVLVTFYNTLNYAALDANVAFYFTEPPSFPPPVSGYAFIFAPPPP